MAAFVATNAKAIADPAPLPKPVPQRAGRIAPVSAPLVLDAAKPYSFAYEVIDPLGGNALRSQRWRSNLGRIPSCIARHKNTNCYLLSFS